MKDSIFLPKKSVLFDLDGVLLDSRPNMKHAWEDVRSQLDIAVDFEEYFKNIGRPFKDILEILGLRDRVDEIVSVYNRSSKENFHLATYYPGVVETLQKLELNGIKLGIVTSKDTERTDIVLSRLPVKFVAVQTPNSQFRGKPAPDHLLLAMAQTNVDPKESIFIGDAEVDRKAAFRAGMDYCHASWGYGEPECKGVTVLKDINHLLTFLRID